MKKTIAIILVVLLLGVLVGIFFVGKAVGNSAGMKVGTLDCQQQVLTYQTMYCKSLWISNNQIVASAIPGCTPRA